MTSVEENVYCINNEETAIPLNECYEAVDDETKAQPD